MTYIELLPVFFFLFFFTSYEKDELEGKYIGVKHE